jgi:hypothetical protein
MTTKTKLEMILAENTEVTTGVNEVDEVDEVDGPPTNNNTNQANG